jgi:hypothetical protein
MLFPFTITVILQSNGTSINSNIYFILRYNLLHLSVCVLSPLTAHNPIYFPLLLQPRSPYFKEECLIVNHQLVLKKQRELILIGNPLQR